mmetsp:Transcript_13654/g.29104  ORF Transcript_13654/g.29104 Transcript_13654/m.29104 type:complete len:82 (-) Transcript_13654:5499-5744(-)
MVCSGQVDIMIFVTKQLISIIDILAKAKLLRLLKAFFGVLEVVQDLFECPTLALADLFFLVVLQFSMADATKRITDIGLYF